MLFTTIKHAISLCLGIFLGYLFFSHQPPQPVSEPLPIKAATVTPVRESDLPPQAPAKSDLISSNERAIVNDNHQQVIERQQQTIEQLKVALRQLEEIPPITTDVEELTPDQLETISIEDFEKRIQTQFMQRFRGFAVKLEGEQLEQIRDSFEKDSTRADWNSNYENNISRFISDSDPNGLHYVDELSCNRNMCRLKVQSSEVNSWQKLYHSMTQQSWYNSMTLTESSADPNTFVYYIPRPQGS